MVTSDPNCISRLPSPSSTITFLSGRATASPSPIDDALPMPLRRVHVEYLALSRLVPRVHRLHRHDGHGIAAPLRKYLYRLVAFHGYSVGAPTMSAAGPIVSWARS